MHSLEKYSIVVSHCDLIVNPHKTKNANDECTPMSCRMHLSVCLESITVHSNKLPSATKKRKFFIFFIHVKVERSASQDEEKTSIGHLWLLGLLLKNMLTCLSHYSKEKRRGRGTKDIFKQ